jgi:hypothetical protein
LLKTRPGLVLQPPQDGPSQMDRSDGKQPNESSLALARASRSSGSASFCFLQTSELQDNMDKFEALQKGMASVQDSLNIPVSVHVKPHSMSDFNKFPQMSKFKLPPPDKTIQAGFLTLHWSPTFIQDSLGGPRIDLSSHSMPYHVPSKTGTSTHQCTQ